MLQGIHKLPNARERSESLTRVLSAVLVTTPLLIDTKKLRIGRSGLFRFSTNHSHLSKCLTNLRVCPNGMIKLETTVGLLNGNLQTENNSPRAGTPLRQYKTMRWRLQPPKANCQQGGLQFRILLCKLNHVSRDSEAAGPHPALRIRLR